MIEIKSHAVDRYIGRVLMRENMIDVPQMRRAAKKTIRKAVNDPDEVYHGDNQFPPVYIKGAVAVPFDYGVVPTAYKSTTFRSKLKDGERPERRVSE